MDSIFCLFTYVLKNIDKILNLKMGEYVKSKLFKKIMFYVTCKLYFFSDGLIVCIH